MNTPAGDWWNELGSKMTIVVDPNDPQLLTGTYHTNVGDAQGRAYPLVGRKQTNASENIVLAWSVVWDPADVAADGTPTPPSVTAWAGQYHRIAQSGVELITASWLLSRQTSPADDWQSIWTNVDYFFRQRPTAEMVAAARQYGKAASAKGRF